MMRLLLPFHIIACTLTSAGWYVAASPEGTDPEELPVLAPGSVPEAGSIYGDDGDSPVPSGGVVVDAEFHPPSKERRIDEDEAGELSDVNTHEARFGSVSSDPSVTGEESNFSLPTENAQELGAFHSEFTESNDLDRGALLPQRRETVGAAPISETPNLQHSGKGDTVSLLPEESLGAATSHDLSADDIDANHKVPATRFSETVTETSPAPLTTDESASRGAGNSSLFPEKFETTELVPEWLTEQHEDGPGSKASPPLEDILSSSAVHALPTVASDSGDGISASLLKENSGRDTDTLWHRDPPDDGSPTLISLTGAPPHVDPDDNHDKPHARLTKTEGRLPSADVLAPTHHHATHTHLQRNTDDTDGHLAGLPSEQLETLERANDLLSGAEERDLPLLHADHEHHIAAPHQPEVESREPSDEMMTTSHHHEPPRSHADLEPHTAASHQSELKSQEPGTDLLPPSHHHLPLQRSTDNVDGRLAGLPSEQLETLERANDLLSGAEERDLLRLHADHEHHIAASHQPEVESREPSDEMMTTSHHHEPPRSHADHEPHTAASHQSELKSQEPGTDLLPPSHHHLPLQGSTDKVDGHLGGLPSEQLETLERANNLLSGAEERDLLRLHADHEHHIAASHQPEVESREPSDEMMTTSHHHEPPRSHADHEPHTAASHQSELKSQEPGTDLLHPSHHHLPLQGSTDNVDGRLAGLPSEQLETLERANDLLSGAEERDLLRLHADHEHHIAASHQPEVESREPSDEMMTTSHHHEPPRSHADHEPHTAASHQSELKSQEPGTDLLPPSHHHLPLQGSTDNVDGRLGGLPSEQLETLERANDLLSGAEERDLLRLHADHEHHIAASHQPEVESREPSDEMMTTSHHHEPPRSHADHEPHTAASHQSELKSQEPGTDLLPPSHHHLPLQGSTDNVDGRLAGLPSEQLETLERANDLLSGAEERDLLRLHADHEHHIAASHQPEVETREPSAEMMTTSHHHEPPRSHADHEPHTAASHQSELKSQEPGTDLLHPSHHHLPLQGSTDNVDGRLAGLPSEQLETLERANDLLSGAEERDLLRLHADHEHHIAASHQPEVESREPSDEMMTTSHHHEPPRSHADHEPHTAASHQSELKSQEPGTDLLPPSHHHLPLQGSTDNVDGRLGGLPSEQLETLERANDLLSGAEERDLLRLHADHEHHIAASHQPEVESREPSDEMMTTSHHHEPPRSHADHEPHTAASHQSELKSQEPGTDLLPPSHHHLPLQGSTDNVDGRLAGLPSEQLETLERANDLLSGAEERDLLRLHADHEHHIAASHQPEVETREPSAEMMTTSHHHEPPRSHADHEPHTAASHQSELKSQEPGTDLLPPSHHHLPLQGSTDNVDGRLAGLPSEQLETLERANDLLSGAEERDLLRLHADHEHHIAASHQPEVESREPSDELLNRSLDHDDLVAMASMEGKGGGVRGSVRAKHLPGNAVKPDLRFEPPAAGPVAGEASTQHFINQEGHSPLSASDEAADYGVPCSHKGVRSNAPTLGEPLSPVSSVQCVQECGTLDKCTHFTYSLPSQTCFLKASKPVLHESDGNVTVLRSCDTSCFENGVSYEDAPDAAPPVDAATGIDCLSACIAEPKCKVFTFIESKGKCLLKGAEFSLHRRTGMEGSLSGPAEFCDQGGNLDTLEREDKETHCIRADIGSLSDDIAPKVRLPTIAACAEHCRTTLDCTHYTYNVETTFCYLKGGRLNLYARAGDRTGARTCDMHCVEAGVTYDEGEEAAAAMQTDTASDCQVICAAEFMCKAFYWTGEDRMCHLMKRNFANSKKTGVRGAVAGPHLFCDARITLAQVEERDKDYGCIRYGGVGSAAEPVAPEVKVFDAEECMVQCQARSDCTHFTFDTATNICALKGGAPQFRNYDGHVTGPRTCNSSCYVKEVSYIGGAAALAPVEAEFPTDCQAICASETACQVFTWDNSEKKCYFIGPGFSRFKKEGMKNAVSGPGVLCGAGGDLRELERLDKDCGCVSTGEFGSTADNMEDAKVADSVHSCMQRCQGMEKCTHFTFNVVSRLCYLKQDKMELIPHSGLRTGPRSCDSSCFWNGVAYGTQLLVQSPSQTRTPNDCQALCASDPLCKVFFWLASTEKCYLKGIGFSRSKRTDVDGAIAGPRDFCDFDTSLRELEEADASASVDCIQEERVLPNSPDYRPQLACIHSGDVGSKTPTIGSVQNAESVEECQNRCQQTKGCIHFTYNSHSESCHLKATRPQLYKHGGDLTGSRTCDTRCLKKGIDYRGAPEVAEAFFTTLASDCQVACAAEPKCKVFSFYLVTSMCRLRGSGFSRYRVEDAPYVISGPKEFCDEGGNLKELEEEDASPKNPSEHRSA
ncbi:hypothetical protein BESB_022700 [Besnoitia besnoiti]|uniref:Apple domain-containing protein n=1 Tax=Besnoitia besnoiti TaxID=94643 RepID=A0A2A9LZF4_BESBE|nr:hypothetical protein BESB_022700 [Besnoitia besnoiti]PFH31778.1 hypothetical protein BESB_022700 [Besnoitia besnoiti]